MKEHVRVSTILSSLQDFSDIPPDVLKSKAQLGTNVHKYIDEFLQKKDSVISSTKEELYFYSFKLWSMLMRPTYKILEKRYYCDKKMITGQIDALIQMPGEKTLTLTDWKTSASPSHKIWPLQAHFYYYLLKVNGVENLSNRFLFVQLDKGGHLPCVHEYKYNENTLNRCMVLIDEYWENVDSNQIKVLT